MIAIELPDWNPVRSSGVMNAYTPSATLTVRYESTEGYEAGSGADCALAELGESSAAKPIDARQRSDVRRVVALTGMAWLRVVSGRCVMHDGRFARELFEFRHGCMVGNT